MKVVEIKTIIHHKDLNILIGRYNKRNKLKGRNKMTVASLVRTVNENLKDDEPINLQHLYNCIGGYKPFNHKQWEKIIKIII